MAPVTSSGWAVELFAHFCAAPSETFVLRVIGAFELFVSPPEPRVSVFVPPDRNGICGHRIAW